MGRLQSAGLTRFMGLVWALLIISVATFGSPGLSESNQARQGRFKQSRDTRLPDVAAPVRYDLSFCPDLPHGKFAGTESILLDVFKPLSTITLNAAELSVSGVCLRPVRPGVSVAAGIKVVPLEKVEQVDFRLPKTIPPGRYELSLSFRGILNDKLRGFYRAHYNDSTGARHTLATTQMEPTDARRMFPCFDEPAYKATYRITAVIDPGLTAISNAPISRSTTDKKTGKSTVTFAETAKMSTYLVALVVGKFEATPPVVVAGVPIRVWSIQGKTGMSEYAQQFAARLLPFYNAYFGIPYPAQKLDLIAIPDFEAGAMENLGAITFRETLLLVDPKTASTDTRQRVAGVVAHEMAHMWFGDLVTMRWWDDLWLNEAFASWMATKAVDKLMPQWQPWDDFALSRLAALNVDSLKSTRSIHFPVYSPEQANEMFDEITYSKGASVLRMLEKYVGEPKFQAGVHRYLEAHKSANASTKDLWAAIESVSGLPVPQVMEGWVNQPGYPLISAVPDRAGGAITLRQKRFFLDPPSQPAHAIWQVPIGIKALIANKDAGSKKTPTQFNLLRAPAQSTGPAPAGTIIANADGVGYFRVVYPTTTLKALEPLIQSRLSVAERLSLLADQMALSVAGRVPITAYLPLTASYKPEADASVISCLTGQLDYLNDVVDVKSRPAFQRLVRDRLGPIKSRLGWDARADEPDRVRLLRGRVLQMLGTIGQDQETIKQARRLFSRYLKSADSVDPNLLGPITRIVAYNGDDEDYQKIRQSWLEARVPELEERNLLALGLFQKPALIKKTLAMCLDDEVRSQDAPHLLTTLLANDGARDMTWQFIKARWADILRRYPMNMVAHVVSAASSFNTPKDESDLQTFFKSHPVPAGQFAVARMLERVRINVRFKQHSAGALTDWLNREFGGSAIGAKVDLKAADPH